MSNSTTNASVNQVECPECGAHVRFARAPLAGEVTRCTGCRAELEVTSLSPLRVELAPEVQEDWGE